LKLFGTKLFEEHSSTPDMLKQPLTEQINLHAWSAQSVGKTRGHMEDAAFSLSMDLNLSQRSTTLGF
jgi:hypothetical protein